MAPAGKKRKTDMPLPNYMVKALECPVCWETIEDPPIFLCEKGHGMCQTCRDPLKAQDQPCPVCRGRLTDTRNLAVENMLDQLPKIKCKNEGCAFQSADSQLVKTHEYECSERPVKCVKCQEPVAISKLWGHLQTKHGITPFPYKNLGEEKGFIPVLFQFPSSGWNSRCPLTKVNNELEFFINWKSYGANAVMFWISFCGTPKEAKKYEYTIKIQSSADKKAGRTKVLDISTGDCISCEVSHEDAKKKGVMLFSLHIEDILKKAAGGSDDKLQWTLVIQKK